MLPYIDFRTLMWCIQFSSSIVNCNSTNLIGNSTKLLVVIFALKNVTLLSIDSPMNWSSFFGSLIVHKIIKVSCLMGKNGFWKWIPGWIKKLLNTFLFLILSCCLVWSFLENCFYFHNLLTESLCNLMQNHFQQFLLINCLSSNCWNPLFVFWFIDCFFRSFRNSMIQCHHIHGCKVKATVFLDLLSICIGNHHFMHPFISHWVVWSSFCHSLSISDAAFAALSGVIIINHGVAGCCGFILSSFCSSFLFWIVGPLVSSSLLVWLSLLDKFLRYCILLPSSS